MDIKSVMLSVATGIMSSIVITIVVAEILDAYQFSALLALPVGIISFIGLVIGTYYYIRPLEPPARTSEFEEL